jgi:hypothetical protein
MSDMDPFGKAIVSPRKQKFCIPGAPPADFRGIQPKAPTFGRSPPIDEIPNFGLQSGFPPRSHPFGTVLDRQQAVLPGMQK